MKKLFYEYYPLSDGRIKEIWDEGIIIFDTNALLNLYRYSEKLKNDFLEVLNHYKNRLWIPYQVGLEYHSNRIEVITNSNNAYKQLSDKLNSEVEKLVNSLIPKYKRHPYINIDDISERIKACINEIIKNLDKREKEVPDYLKDDDILNKLTTLFDGKVGGDLKEDDLKILYKEGQNRYEKKIPPGYCDEKEKKDKGDRHLYGDLILWKQIIQKALEAKTDIILVTDDLKEDWWEITKGKTIGPRKELLKEFREAVQKDILIYNAERFLKYAQEHMSVSIKKETITEIEKFRKEDESIRQIISSTTDNFTELTKVHTIYPWSSAQSIADANTKFSESKLSAAISNINLGKDHICSPNGFIIKKGAIPKTSDLSLLSSHIAPNISDILGIGGTESVSHIAPNVSGILGIGGTESVSHIAPNVSDILGIGGTESVSHIAPNVSDILGIGGTESVSHIAPNISDILGIDGTESVSHIAPNVSGILGIGGTESVSHIAPNISDILGKTNSDGIEGK